MRSARQRPCPSAAAAEPRLTIKNMGASSMQIIGKAVAAAAAVAGAHSHRCRKRKQSEKQDMSLVAESTGEHPHHHHLLDCLLWRGALN